MKIGRFVLGEKKSLKANIRVINPLYSINAKRQGTFEKGLVDLTSRGNYFRGLEKSEDENVVPHTQNYNNFMKCYEWIPKVFNAVNTKADYAIQSGFKLQGNDADVKKIEKWAQKTHFDNFLIQTIKEMILFGNVFVEPLGSGDNLELRFLPVSLMYIIRKKTGEVTGYVQINNYTAINRWNPNDMIHFAWNKIGTNVYGMSEVRPIFEMLEHKLDIESVLAPIAKFHSEPRVIWKLGTSEKPFNDDQIGAWVGKIQDRTVGGDFVCSGDISTDVIQPNQRAGDLKQLLQHIESQIDIGLGTPSILIEGNADVQGGLVKMDSLERRIKTMQDVVSIVCEKSIWTKILGKEEVPTMVWNDLNIETRLRAARTYRQLVGDGKAPVIMTPNEARAELGYKELSDEEQMKFRSMPNEIGQTFQQDGSKSGQQPKQGPVGQPKAPTEKR